jgi:hypothetical protein
MSMGPKFNTKVMGGTSNLGWDGKSIPWRYSDSGARYYSVYWDDDDPGTPSPAAGPAWDDDAPPAAILTRAKAAGRAALAAGYGPSTRADGLVPCGHCTKCDLGRPDLCRQPQQKALARQAAEQRFGDAIARAESDADLLARVVWHEQARRGLAF